MFYFNIYSSYRTGSRNWCDVWILVQSEPGPLQSQHCPLLADCMYNWSGSPRGLNLLVTVMAHRWCSARRCRAEHQGGGGCRCWPLRWRTPRPGDPAWAGEEPGAGQRSPFSSQDQVRAALKDPYLSAGGGGLPGPRRTPLQTPDEASVLGQTVDQSRGGVRPARGTAHQTKRFQNPEQTFVFELSGPAVVLQLSTVPQLNQSGSWGGLGHEVQVVHPRVARHSYVLSGGGAVGRGAPLQGPDRTPGEQNHVPAVTVSGQRVEPENQHVKWGEWRWWGLLTLQSFYKNVILVTNTSVDWQETESERLTVSPVESQLRWVLLAESFSGHSESSGLELLRQILIQISAPKNPNMLDLLEAESTPADGNLEDKLFLILLSFSF